MEASERTGDASWSQQIEQRLETIETHLGIGGDAGAVDEGTAEAAPVTQTEGT